MNRTLTLLAGLLLLFALVSGLAGSYEAGRHALEPESRAYNACGGALGGQHDPDGRIAECYLREMAKSALDVGLPSWGLALTLGAGGLVLAAKSRRSPSSGSTSTQASEEETQNSFDS